MDLLVICLLLPLAISAQRYRGLSNLNNEPFLPIFPVYPYSPKLIKRGAEKDFLAPLNPELFGAKPNARDSYSAGANSNHRRDPTASTQSIYQTAYSSTNQAYSPSQPYATVPRINLPNYNANLTPYALYNGYPVALISAQSHPYYQQVYYSNYNHVNSNDSAKNDLRNLEKSPDRQRNELIIAKDSGFIDGTNYLIHSKDTEDANTYKQSPYSQLQVQPDASELHLRSAQLPTTAYQLVGIEGQQTRQPNYALSPSGYKYQHLDPTMSAALSRLLAHQGYNPTVAPPSNQYEVSDLNQNMAPPAAQPNPSSVIAKTGLAYVMNQPINVAPRHITKMPEGYQLLDSSGIMEKGQRVTQVSLEPSQSVYIPPTMKSFLKTQPRYPTDYNGYNTQASQLFANSGTPNEVQSIPQPVPHQSQAYTYQYTGYNSTPINQEQPTSYRIPFDNINYALKQNI